MDEEAIGPGKSNAEFKHILDHFVTPMNQEK